MTYTVDSLIAEIRQRGLASEYDIELIKTFNRTTQQDFCEKIVNSGFTFKQCLSWYNSYA